MSSAPEKTGLLNGSGLTVRLSDGQLILRLHRQPVHRHPEVVTSHAAQRDMADGTVRAPEREVLRDLGGDGALGARD
jgi:hypothetical protein